MSKCQRYHELIDQHSEELLALPDLLNLERHLKLCPQCRVYQDQVQLLVADLDDALHFPLELDLAPILVGRLQVEAWRRSLVTAGLGVAVLVLLVLNVASILPGILTSSAFLTLARVLTGPLIEGFVKLMNGAFAVLDNLPATFWVGSGLLVLFNKLVLLKLIGVPSKGR